MANNCVGWAKAWAKTRLSPRERCSAVPTRIWRIDKRTRGQSLSPPTSGERASPRITSKPRLAPLPTLLVRLRLQRLQVGLAAQRHDRDLAGAEIGQHDLRGRAVALEQRDVARLGAPGRQIERRPGRGLRIVAQDAVGAPQVGPGVVLLVDRHVIGLLLAGQ